MSFYNYKTKEEIMEKICCSCNTNESVKTYSSSDLENRYLGSVSLCGDCYNRELNLIADQQEEGSA